MSEYENYGINIDEIMNKCRIYDEESGEESGNIDIFRYELYKIMINRIIDEIPDPEEKDVMGKQDYPISFKIAMNTLENDGLLINKNDDFKI